MTSSLPISLVHQDSQEKSPMLPGAAEAENDSKEAAGIQSIKLARPSIKTKGEIETEQRKTLQYMLIDARKIIHLLTSGVCALTSIAGPLLPESSELRRSLKTSSAWLAKLAIGMISGLSGAVDAFKDRKYLLAWSQIGDAITTLFAPTDEITNYRGLWVGAYNALPALETIEGKSQYDGFADNMSSTWSAFKKACKELISRPSSLLDPNQSGMLGLVTGMFTSLSSAIYMFTGNKLFASARDVLGMGLEFEKLKSTHYEAGRNQYIASGWTMLFGSIANMISKFADTSMKEFWSYWNLAANAIGKLFYLDALQTNEPTRTQSAIDFSQMVSNTMREAFDWGKETRASLERSQPHSIQDTKIADRVAELKEEEAKVKQGGTKLLSSDGRSYRYSSRPGSTVAAKPRKSTSKVVAKPKTSVKGKSAVAAKPSTRSKLSPVRVSVADVF